MLYHLPEFLWSQDFGFENDWEKYHQTLLGILKERDAASVELSGYLKELGYE